MKRFIILTILLLIVLFSSSVALAEGGFGLNWWTVDGGGSQSNHAGFILIGTIGQPDAGVLMSGGNYTLAGGFWGAGGLSGNGEESFIYLPIIFK